MKKNTIVFIFDELTKIKKTNRRKYLKSIFVINLILKRQNITKDQFDKYFMDNGYILFDSCIFESPDPFQKPIDLCVNKNTGEVTYDRVQNFLEKFLGNTSEYSVEIKYIDNEKNFVLVEKN